ncbi:hypothetical protein [Polynucleobacter asymbioticus]|jgi:predicted Zn-dependent protease|uniref:Uncharacterized protein n=1 Tax=Polynucleobacter asymbioticus TaxID=576611 RepID=A0AAC9NI32_9BURK|nr:hypothetical protein [Polynucleobacter asymbioticus]APB98206.1 hypothetical protein A4F89_02065 [Polynucleobacter asymbioticus]APC00492.1 hypothetical protein AOC25_02070 [Polynucleobacter asymbioticus]
MQNIDELSLNMYTNCKVAMTEQNWLLAESLLTECFKVFGDQIKPFWYADLNLIKRKLGKEMESDLACTQAIARFPERPLGYACQADNASFKKNWSLAAKLWRELIERFPKQAHPSWRSSLCIALFHCQSSELKESALKILDDFASLPNGTPPVYANNAIKLAQAEQFEVANTLCKTAQQTFPKNADVWRASAVVSNLENLNLRSVKAWKLAASLTKGEQSIECRYQEILALIKAGKYKTIGLRIGNLRKVAPSHLKYVLAQLEVNFARGNYHQALKFLEMIISKNQSFNLIPIQKVGLICFESNLSLEEAKNLIFTNTADPKLVEQLESLYGRASQSKNQSLELLKNEDGPWFKDPKKQAIELRKLQFNFLHNRRCGPFTQLVKYWVTFCNANELNKLYLTAKRLFPKSLIRYQLEQLLHQNSKASVGTKA